ncbi:tannase-domain-containing protein [Rickenella mellea]|uniref:Carboxylic ester hydrolase n=1 Tax=Rickenella mellea TaxID=50990 RepID=A0A4Y7PY00_9AGAM|nr:tannase-domain-containing protein [Rickenella mellea]
MQKHGFLINGSGDFWLKETLVYVDKVLITPTLTMAHRFILPQSLRTMDTTGRLAFFFLNEPEVIKDFAFRAIHVQAVIGKQIVKAYYGRNHGKSYYLRCSTGGRQGTRAALSFPDDFDGVVAGAPSNRFQSPPRLGSVSGKHCGPALLVGAQKSIPYNVTASTHNVPLAIVDWVESGVAPDVMRMKQEEYYENGTDIYSTSQFVPQTALDIALRTTCG